MGVRTGVVFFAVFALMPWTTVLAEESQRGPYDEYASCDSSFGHGACYGFARKNGAVVYSKPDVSSNVLFQVKYGEVVLLLKPGSEIKGDVWLPLYAAVDGPKGPYTAEVRAWAKRADIILSSDFRRVVDCWPLKSIEILGPKVEDEPVGVSFTTQGLVTGTDPSKVRGKQHTYYADGVFLVQHERYANLGYGTQGAIDFSRHIVTSGSLGLGNSVALKGDEVSWFPADVLKGCKDVPKTDEHSLPTPKEFSE